MYLDYAHPTGTLREQFEAVVEATGEIPQELLDEPQIPEGYAGVIEAFWKLNNSSGGESISYAEMLAFTELDGFPLSPLDADIISRCSRRYQQEMAKIRESKS